MNRYWPIFLLSLLLTFVPGTASAQTGNGEVSVSAAFDPPVLVAGQTGTYKLIVHGTQTRPQGNFNAPEGLTLRQLGPSRQVIMRNGDVSVTVEYVFSVRASEPGEYTIPVYSVSIGSKTYTVPSKTLTVTDAPTNDPATRTDGEGLWLDFDVPPGNLYVGQAIPISIHLYASARYGDRREPPTLRDWDLQPAKTGDAFQLQPFSEYNPQAASRGFEEPRFYSAQEETIDGRTFYRLTWRSLLVPLKSGTHDLSFALNTLIETSRDDPFDNLFRPSFPRMLPSPFTDQQRVPLHTTDRKIEILPLPHGKPDSFTGAIGSFRLIEPQADRHTATVGEPITLTVVIEGRGNFDRINPPTVQAVPAWQVRPEASGTFEKSDHIGYEGAKTFRYTLIPRADTITEIPPVVFSWLDPETGEYDTLRSRPIPVSIEPAPEGSTTYALPATRAKTPAEEPGDTRAEPARLLDIMTATGTLSDGIRAPFTSPVFISTNLLILLMLIAGTLLLRRRYRLQNDPAFARRRERIRLRDASLAEATKHAQANRPLEFYAASQRTLQAAASLALERPPESISGQEIVGLLRTSETASEKDIATLEELFTASDAVKFAGTAKGNRILNNDLENLRHLASLIQPSALR